MKFLKWLNNKKVKKMPKRVIAENTVYVKNSVLVKKIQEIENVQIEKFIDKETGKEYKTKRGLKGAITRRLNKAKKIERKHEQ